MAVLYQSDDSFTSGLYESVAAAMETEPAMNLRLSVGIDSAINISKSSTSAAQSLKSSGYRYWATFCHQLPDLGAYRAFALFLNTHQALSMVCPALVDQVIIS